MRHSGLHALLALSSLTPYALRSLQSPHSGTKMSTVGRIFRGGSSRGGVGRVVVN